MLKKAGFVRVDQEGSHQKWRNPYTGRQTIIPCHKGETIRPKTFKKILEGAEISVGTYTEAVYIKNAKNLA